MPHKEEIGNNSEAVAAVEPETSEVKGETPVIPKKEYHDQDFAADMGGSALAELHYSISVEEYNAGFFRFQKKYVYPKLIIMTVLFAVLGALYGQQVFLDPGYTLGWIVLAICVALVGFMWYNPAKIRRNLAKAIAHIKDDTYTTFLYPDGLVVCTDAAGELDEDGSLIEIEPRKLLYLVESPEVQEWEDMFLIMLKKQMFYVIPKHFLKEEQIQALRTEFHDKLDRRFSEKIKNSNSV